MKTGLHKLAIMVILGSFFTHPSFIRSDGHFIQIIQAHFMIRKYSFAILILCLHFHLHSSFGSDLAWDYHNMWVAPSLFIIMLGMRAAEHNRGLNPLVLTRLQVQVLKTKQRTTTGLLVNPRHCCHQNPMQPPKQDQNLMLPPKQ